MFFIASLIYLIALILIHFAVQGFDFNWLIILSPFTGSIIWPLVRLFFGKTETLNSQPEWKKIANTKRERKVFRSRIVIASVFMIAMALLLIYRLFNLQIINHDYYTEEALGNQLQILPIQPIRGDILDRNGKVLATNELSYMLTITPEKIDNINDTFIELQISDLIDEEDIERFNKKFESL